MPIMGERACTTPYVDGLQAALHAGVAGCVARGGLEQRTHWGRHVWDTSVVRRDPGASTAAAIGGGHVAAIHFAHKSCAAHLFGAGEGVPGVAATRASAGHTQS